MVDKTIFGKRIKEARIDKGFTQEQLAEKADMTIVYLSEIERGIKLLETKTRLSKKWFPSIPNL